MVEYAFDLYPSNDPAGKISTTLSAARLARLTVGDQLEDAEFWPSLYGPGKGFIAIHADHADADLLHRRAWVAVIRIDTDPERPIGGFFLDEGDFKALSRLEQRGRVLRFEGNGGKEYFDRYVLGHSIYAPGQLHRGDFDIPFKWTWSEEAAGGVLVRLIEEGKNAPELPYAAFSYDFTRSEDSNGDAWLEEGDYQVDIGTRGDQVLIDQEKRGVIVQVDAFMGVTAFRDIAAFRIDRTSGSFSAGKVRFAAGINILNDLPKRIGARRERTHVLMKGRTGDYQTVDTDTDGDPLASEPFYDYIASKTTANPATLERMGQVYLTRLRTTSDQCKVRFLIGPGGADGAEGYDPGPLGDVWVGDLITVHTGTTDHDYNEQPIEVAAIRIFLDDGNWIAEADLGARYVDSRSASANLGATINSIIQQVSNPIPYCQPTIITEAGIGFISCSQRTMTNGDDLTSTHLHLLPGIAEGDFILAHVSSDSDSTIPTAPAGWTAIGSGGSGSNLSSRGFWHVYDGTEAAAYDFGSGNSVILHVYRGMDEADAIGAIAGGGAGSGTVTFPALTMEVTDGSSWVVAFVNHKSASVASASVAGLTNRCNGRGLEHGSRDTNGGVASWASHTQSNPNNGDWQAQVYELRAGGTPTIVAGDGRAELVGTSGSVKRCDDTEHWHEEGSGEPTVDDDSDRGFRLHTLWINDDGSAFFATDVTPGAAVWVALAGGGGTGAPDDATYLVTTAHAGLSAEVAVGATPGGELGGTWAAPTVDATHSGSTHAAAQAAAEATAASGLAGHTGDASDAHDASAISVLDTGGNFTGADVEAVLAELDAAIGGGGHTEDHDHDGSPTQKLLGANTHETPDTDSAAGSLHHTIGAGATQAAAGNHSHGSSGVVPWALQPVAHQAEGAGGVQTANDCIYYPVVLDAAATINGIKIHVQTQNGNISVALYDSGGTRVATSGAVGCPVATSAVTVNFTAPYSAAAGRYWLALSADGTTAQFESVATARALANSRLHGIVRQTSAHPAPSSKGSTGETTRVPIVVGIINGGTP